MANNSSTNLWEPTTFVLTPSHKQLFMFGTSFGPPAFDRYTDRSGAALEKGPLANDSLAPMLINLKNANYLERNRQLVSQ